MIGVVEAPHPKWTGLWIRQKGELPTPLAGPPKWFGKKKSTKNPGALRVEPGESQPHQIFHQPSNVEPQWACMCKRQAHGKATTDYS